MEDPDQESKDLDEYKALTAVLTAQFKYAAWAKEQIILPRKLKWESLSDQEKQLLPWYQKHLEQLEHSINLNNDYLTEVAKSVATSWGAKSDNPEDWYDCSHQDLDKVRGIMIQAVREWSSIGQIERDASFGRILRECESLFPVVPERQNLEVLVPGAGLGRLVIEFVRRGFRTQGNEFSYHMLLNSSFILNSSFCENNYIMCPFIHKSSNVARRNDQLRQVFIPDFNPGDISFLNREYPEIPVADLMSMVAGSFVDLYGPPDLNKISETYTNDEQAASFRVENAGKFDIVSTCFFLDTSSNIIDYLKSIHHCMKQSGYWLNFGPLLWHHEDDDAIQNSIIINPETGEQKVVPTPVKGLELSKEDLFSLIEAVGFKFIKNESDIETTYGGDDKALGSWKYRCEFWVCQKV